MKYKWFKTVILVSLLTILGISFDASSNTADAASWHRGAPKALIGKYKKGKNSYHGQATWVKVYVTKKYYELNVHDSPSQHVKNISYKKIGKNKYKLRGTGVRSGYYLGGKTSITMKKSGRVLKVGELTLHKY